MIKTLAIFLVLIMFSISPVNSAETTDCNNVKKTSPKYLLCKTKAAGVAVKNKLTKKNKSSDQPEKKSFFKRFKEAKSLSDLKN